jgi:hypothetical protein
MDEKWQLILTVNEFHDGPLFGIAEFRDAPHVYERQFDPEADEYGDLFLLSPIDPDLLDLVLEDWTIWQRWAAAFGRGKVHLKSHPALPADRARHRQIKALIGDRFEAKRGGPIRQFATFNKEGPEWFVRWKDAPS